MQIKVSNIIRRITANSILKSALNGVRNEFINGRSKTGEVQRNNIILKYRYFEPVKGSHPPMLIVLHGSDGRGSDNLKQLNHGIIKLIKEIRKKYSPLILLPQCPSNQVWTINPENPFNNFDLDKVPVSPTLEIVTEIILKLSEEYSADPDRLYIIGSSMGGTGTWEMILRNPGLFAAAVSVCAASDPSKVALVKDVHIWAFSAENDQYYNYRETEETVSKLREQSGDIKYTLYKNQGHNIGDLVFSDPEVIDWLFSQKRNEKSLK